METIANLEQQLLRSEEEQKFRRLAAQTQFTEEDLRNLEEEVQLLSRKDEHGRLQGIDLKTFQGVLKKLTPKAKKNAAQLFALFDSDGDGLIDFRELMTGLATLISGSVDDKLALMFHTYENEETHTLDKYQLEACLKTLLAPFKRTVDSVFVAKCFKAVGGNSRGMINLEQFKRVVLADPMLSEAVGTLLPTVEGAESAKLLTEKQKQKLIAQGFKDRQALRKEYIDRSMKERRKKPGAGIHRIRRPHSVRL